MSEKRRTRKWRVLSFLLIAVMEAGSLMSSLGTITAFAANDRKIDVWDFGGVEETDSSVYINNITADDWDECANVGADAKFVGGVTTFGDLTITHNSGDRLYSISGKNYGSSGFATKAYDDGYTAAGMYYCNGTGGSNRRYLTVENVVAGDAIDVYMASSNAATDNVHFLYLGSEGVQDDTAGFTNTNVKNSFVAQYSGTYQIYTETTGGAKPIFNRVVRIPGVEVTGSIDFAGATTDCVVKFVNNSNGQETAASLDGSDFTVVLAAGYEYTAVLSGATGYGFTTDSKNVSTAKSEVLTGKSGVNLVVEEKTTYTYSGTITGFAADYDISNLSIEMTPPADTNLDKVKLNISDDLSFTALLEPDVEYTMNLLGVNDYEVITDTTLSSNENVEAGIEVALKPQYQVSGSFLDLGENVTVASLTFTNVEDGYTYQGQVAGNTYTATLRDGAYSVTAEATDYRTTTHVVVSGKNTTRDLLFVYTGANESLTLVKDIYVGYSDKANNYETVSEAVAAAKAMNPASEADRITIHIAPGTYREQIMVDVPYITFKNDTPSEEVKLTWYYGIGYKYYSADSKGYYNVENAYDKYEKNSVANWGSATNVSTKAVGFRAENIVFEASFNRYITDEEIEDGVEIDGSGITVARKYSTDVTSKAATERAAAIYVGADQTEFYNCSFLGSQDTLYTGASNVHSYYKNCFIEGNTDYIFGDGNVVFDNCELSFYGYSTGSVGGYLTAAKDGASNGYLFRNCVVTANDSLTVSQSYWGRPWGAGAQVVFANTRLESADLIVPIGWKDMSGNLPENANFKEYNTTALDGNAVDTASRVSGTVVNEYPAAVTEYFGSWTPAYYVAEEATVTFTTAPYLVDNGDINAPYPGHTLTACYSLGTANDANDASVISWYRVSGDTETLVKTASATNDKTYQICAEDTGCTIKVVITPVTVSGVSGEAASYTMEATVRDGYENPDASDTDIELGEGVNIFLAGDSTVKDYSANGMHMSGKSQNEGSWGEFLQEFFKEDNVKVINYANGGRSSRNFINEGSLDKIAAAIGEGDYLFIQFSHNDCANGSGYLEDRYVPLGTPDANGVYPTTAGTKVTTPSSLTSKYGDTFYSYDCGGTFKWYLLQYIEAARSKGAIPVLVTPVARMYYTSDGTIKAHHDSTDKTTGTLVTSDNAYVTAIKQLAEEQDVLLIDAFTLTKDMYENAYKADATAANGVSAYGSQTMAVGDKTHCNKLGGFMSAAYLAQAVQEMGLNISRAVDMPKQVLGETTSGETVFTVNTSNKFTAYEQDNNFTTTSAYWTAEGQRLIDEIGEKADESVSSGDSGNKDDVSSGDADWDDDVSSGDSGDGGSGDDDSTQKPEEDPNHVATDATMWIVGDSTVCSFNDAYYYPRYGYGTQIGNYLDDCYEVQNLALSGRSSLSYILEDNYDTLMSGIKEGDVLVIGFGHNDEKAEAGRYTNPNGDYTTEGSFAHTLYENYVKPAKAAGAEVILCTPIVRRTTEETFSNSQLHITTTTQVEGVTYEGGNYAQAIIDLGEDVNVPVIDLTTLTKELYLSLGAAETKYLHAWTSMSENSVDSTHLNVYGAKMVAYLFAEGVKETETELASHISLGTAPSKEADLVSNPSYVEPDYDNTLAQSALWKDYDVFKGTVFGNIGGASKINTTNFALGEDADGNMRIAALNGNGKITSTADGIAMYYYKVPVGKNFTLKATATVNSMDANSQVAFGLMARDDMYIDKNDLAILSDYVVAGTLGTGTNCFYRRSAAFNKGPALAKETLQVGGSYDLKIESNSDGYACTFGSEATQTGGYDFQLTGIDSDYVYVGMFVSRKADVSYSNISLIIDGEVIVGTAEDEEGGDINPTPTTTPVPTATPEPTQAPAPTATPVPTQAPAPTTTPVPTQAPVPTTTPEPMTQMVQKGVTYKVSGNGVTISKIDKNATSVTIPATIVGSDGKTYKIISIAKNAAKGNTKLTKVEIGSNVTTIGAYAFSGCIKLKTVKIGKNVQNIGDKAFYNCKALTAITIPKKVTTIGKSAFENCTKLKTLKFAGGSALTTIKDKAFSKCTALTKVSVPAKVTTIGKSAFASCTRLSSLTIGNKVSTINASAFSKCTALKKVTIPASVKTIGSGAFANCKNLNSITIKTTKLTTKSVGSKAFSGISSKATIKVPKKQYDAYKAMLLKKGVKKTAKIKK